MSADELPLSEDGSSVQLLVEGMYDANMPVTWKNVGTLLEVSRKYDVLDIQRNCIRNLEKAPVTLETLPRLLTLSCTCGLDSIAAKCQSVVASGDNFSHLTRCAVNHTWHADVAAYYIMYTWYRKLIEIVNQYAHA